MNESPENANCKGQPTGSCVCGGKGPAISQMMMAMMPANEVGEHFRNAGVEFLKGFRELLDQGIHTLSNKETKGTKLNVE